MLLYKLWITGDYWTAIVINPRISRIVLDSNSLGTAMRRNANDFKMIISNVLKTKFIVSNWSRLFRHTTAAKSCITLIHKQNTSDSQLAIQNGAFQTVIHSVIHTIHFQEISICL